MNFSSQASASVIDCFTAQTIPKILGNNELNPDVGGAAVALSNIVINLSLPILLRWGQEGVQTTVCMLLSQVYPIMMATAASINSNNLSLFDAHFAVAVTASPISVYLAYSSFRYIFKWPNSLFQKRSFGKTLICCLGVALPFLWLTINLTLSFYPRAFRNSLDNCQKMTFMGWFEFQAVSNFIGILDVMGRRDLWNDLQGRGGLGAISLTLMWIWGVHLVRHRYDIVNEIRLRRKQQAAHSSLHKNLLTIVDVFYVSWLVVTKSHPWMVIAIVMCLHWSWVLGIAKGMIIKDYQFSYGQIMSLFAMIPPLMSVGKLLRERSKSLLAFLKKLPGSFSEGVRFLFTGTPNPWISSKDEALHPSPIFMSDLEWYWLRFLLCLVWLVTNLVDGLWITTYVRAGSTPNPRTPVNDPHNAWKPFSVSLYIFGYCVCCLNILVWTIYFDKYPVSGGNHNTPLHWERSMISNPQRRIFRLIRLALIPVAFLMCVGPLFCPFAALPLAQQWQWTHFCDSFQGEAILSGTANQLQTPTASFYYSSQTDSSIRELYFDYSLITNTTGSKALVFNGISNSSFPPPDVLSITYDEGISAHCHDGICGFGNYSAKPYLSFRLQDSRTGAVTQLRAVDKEWEFNNDAPSVVLRFQTLDGKLAGIALQSAVTQRNHCETLKVCLSSSTPDFTTLAPLGVLLMAQDVYAGYCLQPRIYQI